MERSSSHKTNLFYTICIFLNHFAFGISSNVLWAALVDLSHIYNTSVDKITFLGTFASTGYLIGSLSGCLYKWINRQLTLSLLVICIALTIAFVPHYQYVAIFFGMVTLNGIGGGSWDSSNNIWLVEMWPSNNAPIIQSSQFMYGLGTIVGPILMSPYVQGDNTTDTNGTSGYPVEDITPEKRISLLTIPFAITGIIQIIVPVIFFINYFMKPYRKIEKEIIEPFDESGSSESRGVVTLAIPNRKLKLFLVALCLATYDAAEIGYFYYSPTMFQFLDIKLIASEAAHVSSVLSAAYTAGRLVTAFISFKLKPDIIITYHYVIIAIAQLMLFFGNHNKIIIYVATVLLGFGFSAMWPAILAFTQRHLKLSDRVGSLLFFFAGLVSIFTPFIIGSYLETAPLVLFLFEGIYLIISLILFATLRLFCL